MVSKEQLDLEDNYEKTIESNVEQGIINPRLIRWWEESSENEEPVKSGSIAKERYSICRGCEEFTNTLKMCGICKCFMPLKVQLVKSKCPKGIWK